MASPNPKCSAPAAPSTTEPTRYWLPRKAVLAVVGGRRRLAKLERAGCLVRHYPAGLRQARYRFPEVRRFLVAAAQP